MKKKCLTCELIKTGGIFTGAYCKDHPNKTEKEPFFKGFKVSKFFKIK